MAKLLVQESAGVREFELVDAEIQIGRELDNTLRLADPSVSRHHAVLRRTPTGYEVQDLESSNGVLLNGSRVQASPLRDGDRITLGQMQLTFMDPQSAEPAGTVALPASAPSPLGTVRMPPQDLAKLQAPEAEPALPIAPPAEPIPACPEPAPPAFGHFTNPGVPVAENPAPAFLQSYLPPVPDDAQPTGERGDFVTRLLAQLIDGALCFVCALAIWIIEFVLMAVLGHGPLMIALGCVFGLVQFAIGLAFLFFFPWCWIKFGASPGKKIMKLRVVPEDNPTGRIDVGTAVLRIVGHMINGVLFCLPYLMILGAERKGLQDILSKSIVIKVDR